MKTTRLFFLLYMLVISGCAGNSGIAATSTPSASNNDLQTITPVNTRTPRATPTSSPTFTPTVIPTSTSLPWYISATQTISDQNIEQLSLVESFYIPSTFGGGLHDVSFDFSHGKWEKRQITLLINQHSYKDQITVDLTEGKITHIFPDLENPLVIISKDEAIFAFGNPNYDVIPTIKIIKSTNLDDSILEIEAECEAPPKYQGCYLYPDAFNATGTLLISSLGIGGSWGVKRPVFPIYVWDTANGSLSAEYRGKPGQEYNFVKFGPDDNLFLMTSYGYIINNHWDLFSLIPLEKRWSVEFKPTANSWNRLASFSSNGKYLAVSSGGNISTLDMEDGSLIQSLHVVGGTAAFTFAPDSSQLFAIVGGTGRGNKIAVFDAMTGEVLKSFYPGYFVTNISISPDGNFLFLTKANPGQYAQLDVYMVK